MRQAEATEDPHEQWHPASETRLDTDQQQQQHVDTSPRRRQQPSAKEEAPATSPTSSSGDSSWTAVSQYEARSRGTSPKRHKAIYSSDVNGPEEPMPDKAAEHTTTTTTTTENGNNVVDKYFELPEEAVKPHPKDMETALQPQPGEAVAAPADSSETHRTHEEMSKISAVETPFLMNRE